MPIVTTVEQFLWNQNVLEKRLLASVTVSLQDQHMRSHQYYTCQSQPAITYYDLKLRNKHACGTRIILGISRDNRGPTLTIPPTLATKFAVMRTYRNGCW